MTGIVLDITVDDGRANSGLDRLVPRVKERVEASLARGAMELARAARRKAPKAFSTLTNSIRDERLEELHYRVAPHVNYAVYVEKGVRPGKQPGTANGLMEWVRQKTGLQGTELDRRTFLVARALKRTGIRAQPYMKPAFDENKDRIIANVRSSAAEAKQEAFNG